MKIARQFSELVGIIGGVGPEATNYFTSLLIRLRGIVKNDQEHIPFLLHNNPQIPDRTKYLLYGGENPLAEFVQSGLLLKQSGATFLVIPCHTAHAFIRDLEKEVCLPIMNMVDVTVRYVSETYGKEITVGLLASSGTLKSKIYQKAFTEVAPTISVIEPKAKTQATVMEACYNIKKFSVDKDSFRFLNNAAHELITQGASVIILACTEIPLALNKTNCSFPIIDPMEIVAKKVIEKTLVSKVKAAKQSSRFLTEEKI